MRLGVVGHGLRISSLIKDCFRKAQPDLKVVGIVDPDEKNARANLDLKDQESVVFYSTLAEMIKKAKVDALAIGTRCNLHTPYAIQAARFDIPLFLEKPVAISMKQALALDRAFDKSRCRVVVSFPLRVSPLCTAVRKHIESGEIGSAEHILAVNYVPYGTIYWDMGYRNYDITQGLFLQKATHDFDYMMYLMNSKIVRVSALANFGRVFGGKKRRGLVCSRCKEAKTCNESPENRIRNSCGGQTVDHPCVYSVDCGSPQTGTNEDCSSALVEFANGSHGLYTQVFFSRRDAATRGSTISGYKGTISFDWYKNEIKLVHHHSPFTNIIKADDNAAHFGGDTELAREFFEIINGKTATSSTIWDGLQSVYTCLAAKESLAKGKFVKVRQVAR